MRSSFIATTGLKLARSPSLREQVGRRRAVVLGALLGLAATGAAFGLLTAPQSDRASSTSPFSYFPSE
ncbi:MULTISPECIES: YtxH domain-containing protein [unclassified Phenylobacterium]|jgi:hypothetical protein|uniref:YtxH domain-containing protein n=1 Tax=unclassified Phenylobacterium TaxID=2640670 RepID=UPI00083AC035|nr:MULTISPECIES: YtxH domain-containing protein [unclassified Phenylobacterium]